MNSISQLNAFSSGSVSFTVDTITTPRTVGQSFDSPVVAWPPVRQLGELTGQGVRITYNVANVANTTVTFPSVASSINPLTTSNPSTGVYVIQGIIEAQDYLAAQARINPPVGFANTVTYTANVINTNNVSATSGYFFLSINGVPE